MTPEEVTPRSLYLYLACASAAGESTQRLVRALSIQEPRADKIVRRELGLLFRYWTTREIWQALETNEASAKALNLALLRLFTDGFRLPRDGTGLRYAELSSASEEMQELSHRLTGVLGQLPDAFMSELSSGILPWRDAVLQATREALTLPLARINESVRAWAVSP